MMDNKGDGGSKKLVELVDGAFVGEVVLPESYGSFRVKTNYVVGNGSEGIQNKFADDVVRLLKEEPEVLKDAYCSNGDGLILELRDKSYSNNGTDGSFKKLNRLVDSYLEGFVGELTGIKFTPVKEKSLSNYDWIEDNGSQKIIPKTNGSREGLSLLAHNTFEGISDLSDETMGVTDKEITGCRDCVREGERTLLYDKR